MTLPTPLTVGDMIDIANKVQTAEDASALLTALTERAMAENSALTHELALTLVRANLGYLGGYCGVETQRRWESLFGAVHPIFGAVGSDTEPKTVAETFQRGVALGKILTP